MKQNNFRPGPRTSAKNANDPRVIKTVNRLREGYIELLNTMPADMISVLRLSEKSEVDRKTFYLHYRNIEDMKNDVIDMTAADLTGRLIGDLEQDIRTIYTFLDSMDGGIYALLEATSERDARDRFLHEVFTSDAFSRYYTGADPDVIEGYLYSIIYIYEENTHSDDPLDTTELARRTSKLLQNGIHGIEESDYH